MTEQSLAELAGHDLDAMSLLASLGERLRREGITGLRAAVGAMLEVEEPGAYRPVAVALIVEAVLTIAERTGTTAARTRDAWAHLEADEARTEQQQIDQGGNR